MKIVILDGYTLNPGDLSWEAFEALGEVVVYDRSTPEEVEERAKGCDVLITNKAIVSAETIRNSESLKYIGVTATGVNIVDVEAAMDEQVKRYADNTLNELEEFEGLNPSIEHFSRILWERMAATISTQGLTSMTIRVWEDDFAWARYTKPLNNAA